MNDDSGRIRQRKRLTDEYVTIRTAWLHNNGLSFCARGILAAVAALDEGAYLTPGSIAAMSRESADTVGAALRELEDNGYLSFADAEGDVYLNDPHPFERPAQTVFQSANNMTPISVVYYLQSTSGHVKIGFSAHLTARLRKLRDEHGELLVLATEPGGWHREQELHRIFDAHRVRPDREWFWPGDDLLQHIADLAGTEASA